MLNTFFHFKSSVSKVKNITDTKVIPATSKIKIVREGLILIFLNEYVGILLINNNEIIIVRMGVINSKSIIFLNSDNSFISGIKIRIAPIGDGIPSK